ncbi:MAG: hypothetical protein ACE5D6_09605, partial [Candidatus Zixiibacteriota bacterium]
MNKNVITYLLLFFSLISSELFAQKGERLVLNHADQFEVVLSGNKYISYVVGDVIFKTKTGFIYSDS